jgi:hypothetical protein
VVSPGSPPPFPASTWTVPVRIRRAPAQVSSSLADLSGHRGADTDPDRDDLRLGLKFQCPHGLLVAVGVVSIRLPDDGPMVTCTRGTPPLLGRCCSAVMQVYPGSVPGLREAEVPEHT